MSALADIAAVAGLGAVGLDPYGALIAVGAVSAGARRRAVLAFVATTTVTTIAVGVLLSTSIRWVGTAINDAAAVPDAWRAVAQIIVGVALIVVAFMRWRRRNRERPTRGRPSVFVSTWAMSIAGALWGVSALSDATFYGIAGLGATTHSVALASVMIAVWFLITQVPLYFVAVALIIGRDSALLTRAITFTRRIARVLKPAVTIAIAIIAACLLINAATYLVSGDFLPA